MYMVIYKPVTRIIAFHGYEIKSFESLDEAKGFAKKLYMDGRRNIRIVQNLPVEFTVEVEI